MKTVLVTGASGDIGSAVAKAFRDNGYNVTIHYNSNETFAQKLALDLDAFCVKADISCMKDVECMFDQVCSKYGNVDVLVNNAGIQHIQMLCDTSPEAWQKVMDVNLTGTYNCTKCAVEKMMWHGGKIINISSVWGQCGGACESAYSASKAGVIGFTKSLAKEYSAINVNCICPGVIESKMNEHLTKEDREELKEQIPLKRFGKPEDVAELAVFLASSKADYITGQIIAVNGGMYI